MNALILVDLQNDFLAGGALAVESGDEVIPIANQLQPYFDLIVATQDWHPPDHGSFADNHLGGNVGDQVALDGLPQILWPVHCVQRTPGAALADSLDVARIAKIFYKGTESHIDSYSGFYDNAQRRSTGLAEYLRQQGVTTVYVLGLATDYCVKFSALDARRSGFQTFVVADACRGVNLETGDVDRAWQAMQDAGAKLITSSEIVASPPGSDNVEVLARGRRLRLVRRGRWEFVQRDKASGVVIVLALSDDRRVLFVEQYRPPVQRRVIEFPAGLAGDLDDRADESLSDAACRELLEETGYRAATMRQVFRGPSSAGLSDEIVTFFVATDLTKAGPPAGDTSEDIVLHEVPLSDAHRWLQAKRAKGYFIGARVYTGLFFLQSVGGE